MRRVMTALLAIAMLSMLWTAEPEEDGADAWVMDKVNEDKDQFNLTFPQGGGDDNSAFLSLPDGKSAYSAHFGVKGVPAATGKYPENIWLDVGRDGDFEWMWWGNAYGELGRQQKFGNNQTGVTVPFDGDGVNSSATIRLPAGAVVTGAHMDVEGRAGVNNGVLVKRQDATPCRIYVWSSMSTGSGSDPILTINYASGGPLVIQPDEDVADDTTLSAAAPNTNYATNWALLANSNSEQRALLKFDLSAIDPEQTITSAVLELRTYSYEGSVATPQVWGIHEVQGFWDESVVTWNTQPPFNATPVTTHDVDYQYTTNWVSYDITPLVDKWLNTLPSNVTVDLGGDGKVEYKMQGLHDFTNTTTEFSDKLNQYLVSATPGYQDEYGNSFVDVPLRVTSNTTGAVFLSNLSIEYDYTATVFKNPHNFNLTQEVNEHMLSLPPVGESIQMYIGAHSEKAGVLRIKDVNISYNGDPRPLMVIPSNLSIPEDTSDEYFLDLSQYFEDDFEPPDELIYDIKSNSKAQTIGAYITDGRWLSVDAEDGVANDDWNGNFTLVVRVSDEQGFFCDSNPFKVTVTPVNDEPVVGDDDIPDLSLLEGGSSQPLDLDTNVEYFDDVDGPRFWFGYQIDPFMVSKGHNITVSIDNDTNMLTVDGNGDFSGDDIPLRIYCDDDQDLSDAQVYQDILVDVVNVNDDPPVWSTVDDIHMDEDGALEDALFLEDLVWDVDDDVSELRYTIAGNTNGTAVSVKVDDGNYVDLKAIKANWTGETTVKVRASDSGENVGEVSFRVIVDPVNDLPVATLIEPPGKSVETSARVILSWSAVDAESDQGELVYRVYVGEESASVLVADGEEETSLAVSVQDGMSYRWAVAASDGTGYGPRTPERAFSVDFSSGPRVTLESPQDGAFVTASTSVLSWNIMERPSGTGGTPHYDVLMGESEESLETAASGVMGTSWTADGLVDGRTYYWTVIPEDSLGRGTCLSGVWGFEVDFDFAGYGVGFEASTNTLGIAPGGSGALTVTLSNTGAAPDNYRLSGVMTDIPGATVAFAVDDAGQVPLAEGTAQDIQVTVTVPSSTASGSYLLTLVAKSLKGGAEESLEITVTVSRGGEPGPGGTDGEDTGDEKSSGGMFGDSDTSDMLVLVLLLVVIALAVMAALFGSMYRRKKTRVDELEGRRRLEPASMVDAELAFSPDGSGGAGLGGAAGAVGPGQQLGTGAAAPGAPGGAAAPQPLALPRVATGGETPAGVGDAGEAADAASGTAAGARPLEVETTPSSGPAFGAPYPKPAEQAWADEVPSSAEPPEGDTVAAPSTASNPKPRPRPRPKPKAATTSPGTAGKGGGEAKAGASGGDDSLGTLPGA